VAAIASTEFRQRSSLTPRVLRIKVFLKSLFQPSISLLSSDPSVRASGRSARVMASLGLSFLSTIIAISTNLLLVPLTIQYLGQERYGVWVVLSSLSTLLGIANIGLGAGLQNAVSTAAGRDDWTTAARYVSTAFIFMSLIAAGAQLVLMCVSALLPWAGILNVHQGSLRTEVQIAAVSAFSLYLASLPIAILQRVQAALQQGFVVDAWRAVGSVLTLVAVYVATRSKAGLPMLVILLAGIPVLTASVNVLLAFIISDSALRPRLKYFDWHLCKKLTAEGALFTTSQAGQLVMCAAPVLLATRLFGAATAGCVGLVQKLSQLPTAAITLITFALWPAFTEAEARGDLQWIRTAAKRLAYGVGFAILVLAPVTAAVTPRIVYVWSRAGLEAPFSLTAAFAALTALMVIRGSLTLPLFSSGRILVLGTVMPMAAAIGLAPLLTPHLWASPTSVILWLAVCELVPIAIFTISLRAWVSKLLLSAPSLEIPYHNRYQSSQPKLSDCETKSEF
jgi:O-antigen/teichoic acid export membrane protein